LVGEFRQRKLGIRRAGPDRTANSIVSGQRTASDAAAVSPAISAAVAATADARAAESGTAQTETAQTGTGQTITSTSTASAPQVVVREGPQGFVRVRPLHPAWRGKEPPERP
jgi:hypothetical protein